MHALGLISCRVVEGKTAHEYLVRCVTREGTRCWGRVGGCECGHYGHWGVDKGGSKEILNPYKQF